jgi:superfamily II RNA helicase
VFSSLGKIKETAEIDEIFPLLVRLKEQNELPAIIFSFDRNICETLALKTASKVIQKARAELKHAPKAVQFRLVSTAKNPDGETLRQTEQPMDFSRLVESQFSFVDPKADTDVGVDDSWLTENEKFLLSLGIGVHHAGKGTKYRQMVEFMFRTKAIQVVFATSTLALGVNMPCKTVIFAKDSMFLNSLSFRQMSGRAGRRGFDKKGNVIFLSVSTGKMKRLFNGDLPILETKFPLSVTLVLRAFTKTSRLQQAH